MKQGKLLKTIRDFVFLPLIISFILMLQIETKAENVLDEPSITIGAIAYTIDMESQTAMVSEYINKAASEQKEATVLSKVSYEGKEYTVTSIKSYAFSDASYLEKIVIPVTVKEIGSAGFISCGALKAINLPSGIKEIKESTFLGCMSLEEIVIPDTVERIGMAAFLQCYKLKKIEIPDSVKEIDSVCFQQCEALEEVILPKNLTELSSGMFILCSNLEKIVIPYGVTRIESHVFVECDSLKEVVFPESVEYINERVFDSNDSLERVVLPDSLKNISGNCFYNCVNLKQIYYSKQRDDFSHVILPNDTTQISYIINDDGTVSLTVEKMPEGVTDIQLPADIGGHEIASVTGPEGVEIPISCAKHRFDAYNKDTKQHWRVCSVCKEEIREAHAYGNGAEVCVCNYIPFEISEQSKDVTLESDYPSASLMVKIKKTLGTENVSCQWYEDGKEIRGATNTSYTIPAGKTAGTYRYTCKISCEGYVQTTKVMMVTVNAPKKETVTKPEKKVPVKGKKYKDDKNKATYKVTNARINGKGTVEYVKPVSKKKSVVTIPATVKIGGITYKVTSIAKNAFKNNKYIKRLTIEKNVENIGAKAFYGCKKLKDITIKTSKLKTKKIGTAAFKKTPSNAKIKVPKKKLKAYKAMLWKKGVSKKAKIRKK